MHDLHWLEAIAQEAGLVELPLGVGINPHLPTALAWHELTRRGVGSIRLQEAVARHFGLPIAQLGDARPTEVPEIDEALAIQYQICPLRRDPDGVGVVATANPGDLEVERSLAFVLGRPPRFEVTSPLALSDAIGAYYDAERTLGQKVEQLDTAGAVPLGGDTEGHRAAYLLAVADSAPIVNLVNLILEGAIDEGASDVHVEPRERVSVVRYRIDGTLRQRLDMSLEVHQGVVARIKVMANMDIADHLRPQDGRARVHLEGRDYDLRVSSVPTGGREKVAVRVLEPGRHRRLADLGLLEPELLAMHRLLSASSGIIYLSGPTGSGKSTTLYAALGELCTGEENITTIEDPIEYRMTGITQLQVETKQGMTFGRVLRHVLRQDPNVILVGETRDQETAELVVQAGLTGHLVLTTLHASDAPGVVARLADLGISRALIAETLVGAAGQRLLRRICGHCASADEVRSPLETRLADRFSVDTLLTSPGCRFCKRAGYRGRIPLLEVLTNNAELTKLIVSDASQLELRDAAHRGGMRPLVEVGLELVARSETTLAELHRVVGEQGLDVFASRVTRATRIDDRIDSTRIDPLSGQLDRFALAQRFRDWHESRKDGRLSLASVTIDQLTRVNEDFGLEAGNRLIRVVADALRNALTAEDDTIALGRWRAGELVVLFPGRDAHVARAMLVRACAALEGLEGHVPIATVTGAVVAWTTQINIRELLALADPLWRRAYDRGGNDIQVALQAAAT